MPGRYLYLYWFFFYSRRPCWRLVLQTEMSGKYNSPLYIFVLFLYFFIFSITLPVVRISKKSTSRLLWVETRLKQVFAFFCAAGRFSSGASFFSLLSNWRRTSSSILLGSSGDWKVIPPDYSTGEPMTTDWTSLTLESRCDLFCRGRICMIFSLTGTLQMVLPFTKYHYIVSSLLSYASLLYRGQRRYTP